MEEEHLPSVYVSIANSYVNIGEYERVGIFLRKALELEYGCGVIRWYTILMLAQGKFQEALQITDSICQEVPCEWLCNGLLFEESLLLGEFEKAEQYFYKWQNTGQEIGPFERSIGYEIGYVYYQLGKKRKPRKYLRNKLKNSNQT